jgi:8-hydroxy-5-deazaflavin:NADPH oxidoreductase
MKIAIIGAGNVGGALAVASTKAGHTVVLAAIDPAHAKTAADAAGAQFAATNAEAVNGADVVILAVPGSTLAAVAAELGRALDGKVVVDSTNPLNDSYSDLTTSGVSASELLQRQLPGAKVVKAFNTIFAGRHANPTENGQPLDAFLAGDDSASKATVSQLADSLGYRVIDSGGLRMARSLEEMAFLNISLNAANGWAWQSGWKLIGPTASTV